MLPVALAVGKIILEGLVLAIKCSRLEVALTLLLLTHWPPLTTWRPGSAILPHAWKAEGKNFWQTALMTSTVSVVVMLPQWKHLVLSVWLALTFLAAGCHCWLRRTTCSWEGLQKDGVWGCLGVQEAEQNALFSYFLPIQATNPSAIHMTYKCSPLKNKKTRSNTLNVSAERQHWKYRTYPHWCLPPLFKVLRGFPRPRSSWI